jgi:hypothetical protein
MNNKANMPKNTYDNMPKNTYENMPKNTYDNMSNDKIMVAPNDKGFTIFRGDTARLENGKIIGTLYDIGKPLRPSIGRSWTTSHTQAKKFACYYSKDSTASNVVPIIYHGISHKLTKGLFWDLEREVHILRDKSILKKIEIVDKKDCEIGTI